MRHFEPHQGPTRPFVDTVFCGHVQTCRIDDAHTDAREPNCTLHAAYTTHNVTIDNEAVFPMLVCVAMICNIADPTSHIVRQGVVVQMVS